MSDVPIQIVDENNKPTGEASKEEAWRDGLRHRVVRVMAIRSDGKILLQKRAPEKPTHPNCWDNSAAGHVDAGEAYETAAKRELAEELGIEDMRLEEIARYESSSQYEWRKMNRFVRVYRARLEQTPTKLPPREVSEVRWFTPEEIKELVEDHPEQTSDGLQEIVEHRLLAKL